MKQTSQIIFSIVMLAAVAMGIWKTLGARQANNLVDEANAAIDEGNKFTTDAAKHYQELFKEENLRKFPGNRTELKPAVQQTVDLFGKSAEKFLAGEVKFVEASRQKVDRHVSEYWTCKAQQLHKLAEAKQSRQQMALLLIDESVSDIHKLNEKLIPLSESAKKLDAETAALAAKAEKIKTDHAASFN